tara:strand:+ start:239 stop:493 length:255 start_codon:yes stop_codon:yes gene_type:complete
MRKDGKYPSKGMNKLASKRPDVAKKIMGYKKGGSAYHTTKDGRRVKKGLYYYMNRAKKRGTSKPGKGTVTDKALRRSAKTAKKA